MALEYLSPVSSQYSVCCSQNDRFSDGALGSLGLVRCQGSKTASYEPFCQMFNRIAQMLLPPRRLSWTHRYRYISATIQKSGQGTSIGRKY